MTHREFLAFAIAIAICCTNCSCSSTDALSTGPVNASQIRGAGATFPAPLYKKWLEEYRRLQPDVLVTYDAVGSGEGVKRFLNGTVDFGASDAAMLDAEIARVRAGVQLVPTTAGDFADASCEENRSIRPRVRDELQKWSERDRVVAVLPNLAGNTMVREIVDDCVDRGITFDE